MPTRVDVAASAGYRVRLERYFEEAVLDGAQRFICTRSGACEASAHARDFGFAAGQLSFVGPAYACAVDAVPLRILVVSMQVGDAEAPVTVARRDELIRARVPEPPGRRNPHMRGVTRALQVLHGLSPDRERLGDGTHVLDAHAMANSVLCSALPTGGRSRRGKPTGVMLRNCQSHLSQTLELLAPTIIHAQGTDTRAAIERLTQSVRVHSPAVSEVVFGGRRAILCALSHPAAGPPLSWSSTKPGSHFADVVVPALELTRRLAIGAGTS